MKNNKGWFEIFLTSLKLGLTSFGGPVAHLGYFKNEYVDKRKWLDDKSYADVIALSQFLPGPASSQVGIAIGMFRGGVFGGVLSWLGFTIPSVVILMLFAVFYQSFHMENATWIASLKIVAVAVVAHAVLGLGKKLTPDAKRLFMALIAAIIILLFPSALTQIMIIIGAAVIGYLFLSRSTKGSTGDPLPINMTKRQGMFALFGFVLLLIILPFVANVTGNFHVQLFDKFYRVGSIVFGGGHVVLPLLEQEVVAVNWLSASEFIAGYGVAQAVPGPLFTFASYLGMMMNGMLGAMIATIAIFLPSFLLIIGALPFLSELRQHQKFQGMLAGVNASVVGILLAALYDPLITSSIQHVSDIILAVLLFALLQFFKRPAWLVVMIGVIVGQFVL